MDQFNLDAMFDNMLGELDIISQQLEESSTEASKSSAQKLDETEKRSSGYSQNSSDTSSSQGYSKPPPQVSVTDDASDDIDLSEMLNDLTDWEHNLTSGQGQMPAMKSASQDSGIGFNGNSLPRNTNLSAQYGMEGSPQFNTLKRATTGGPSVTFGDEDELSLTSLEKDIEQEKREQDKSRQLTPEELSALSPVMQELDDLVSDLSNLSFQHDYDFAKQASERKPLAEAPAATVTNYTENATTKASPSQNSVIGASGSSHSQNVALSKNAETPTAVVAPYETVSVSQRMDEFRGYATANEPCHANGGRRHSESENVLQKRTVTFSQDAAAVSPTRHGQFAKWPPENADQKPHMMNGGFRYDVNHDQGGTKPPMPPPVASKPKLPEKPQPQQERPFVAPGPKPALPVKRQTSVKAPANLSGILAKQLNQQNSLDASQRSPTSPGPIRFPGGSVHGSSVPNRTSLLRQNSAEIRVAPPMHQTSLARQHSTSRSSIKSSVSATGSIASVRSSSSTESTASEASMHSADERLSRYSFVPMDVKRQLEAVNRQADIENLAPEEREERIKAEKMRIALEKLKEARIQKLVVKVYNKDDSSKTLVVDERMTTRSVVRQLLEKNVACEPSVNWALIEELPSLFMERIFEEHEQVTEMLSYWTRDTTNQVRFLERKDKYALFRNPQHYLLTTSDTEGQMAERQKQTLIEEFFSGRSGTGVPEVQGTLYLKGDSKSWAKKYCVLRTSGLYCSKGGEPKKGKKVSDLQCLVMFEQVCVYLGRGWKKKYKSPTDYGFALKHPAIQTKSKHIKYFCCDDVRSLMRWIVGIRCAKYGKQLKENYDKTNEEMKGNVSVSGLPFQAQHSVDSTSTMSTDSGDPGSRQNTLPRANLSNVFEGAWQRASQQENAEAGNEGHTVQRVKSVWKPQQAKTNSNWWDLSEQGGAHDTEDSSGSATISNRTSATSNIGSVISNNRISVSSTGSHGSNRDSGTPTFVPPSPSQFSQQQNAPFKPPTPSPVTAHHPPAPPPMMGMPQQHKNHVPPAGPYANKGMPPAPPANNNFPAPAKAAPPPPPMKPAGPPPPPNKPHHARHDLPPFGAKPRFPAMGHRPPQPLQEMAPPPPPLEDMPPPPPADEFMPPPPPMEDLPPPPLDDDMPLPPPMEVTPNPGLPKGLRGISGPAPVRLPMLPMFNNGGFPRMRMPPPAGPKLGGGPPPPGPKPLGHHGPPSRNNMGYPPPPTNNYNYSNNKPPLPPREDGSVQAQPTMPPYKSRTLNRKPSNPNYRPESTNQSAHSTIQAPLTRYYNSNASPTRNISYKKNEFPPPPEFVLDLKDTFHQVNYSVPGNKDLNAFDLPPPPPELLLNEVMSRRQPPCPPPKSAKPAPPPPKRSPSTKLSFKRR